MRIKKLQWIFLLAIFLLPWQTQFVYHIVPMAEGISEYGKFGLFFTEFLIAIAFLLSRKDSEKPAKEMQNSLRGFYLFLAAGFLSLTFAPFYSVSLFSLGHILFAGMLFLMLLDPRTKIDRVCIAFALGLIVPCILGWYQYLHGFSPASTLFGLAEKHVETQGIAVVATNAFRSLRAYGSFPHPNIFGGYLAVGIMILSRLTSNRPPSPFEGEGRGEVLNRALLYSPLIVLFASTLVITFSRSAWLALACAIFVIIVIRIKQKRSAKKSEKLFLIILFATIALSALLFHPHIFARFDTTQHVEAISIEERTSQYTTFPSVFRLNPVFGVGAGAYTFALESLHKNQPVFSYQPIHNAILLILAEFGFVGFIAFVYWIFELAKFIWSRRTHSNVLFATAMLVELFFLAALDHYLFSIWSGLALAAFSFAVCIRIFISDGSCRL